MPWPPMAIVVNNKMLRSTTNFASLETTPGDGVKIGNTNIGQSEALKPNTYASEGPNR